MTGFGFLNFKIFTLLNQNFKWKNPPWIIFLLLCLLLLCWGDRFTLRTHGYSGTGLASSYCHWCPCENRRPCREQVKNTTLCLFLWAVTADQSRKRWGIRFSANVSATTVWLANGFFLVTWKWPKKEASAIFAWLEMMFQPTSAQMHTWFSYFLASAFKNNHRNAFQSVWAVSSPHFVVFSLRKQFSFFLSHAKMLRMKACM